MKKSLILLACILTLSPFQVNAGFGGFGLTLGTSYDSSFSSSTLTSPFQNSIDLSKTTWGKSYVDIGYTYVLSTGIPLVPSLFLGGSVVGGWNSFKVDAQNQLQEFSGGFYAGLKAQGGIIFTLAAVKVMAEIDTQSFSYKTQNQTGTTFGYGGYSLGVGLDFSAPLIPVVLGIGMNFKYPPNSVTFQTNGVNQDFGFSGSSFEVFAEIGIRL